ncbi:MAG TPA: HPr(Ser) kinase/phosphatase [Kiritimatiellia bacterium]|nr:HPr(Ser) kinase/phosphatase [Kiritimatiellia bacterium]HMO97627.1 HPr(Ser) kinase/phosphatase [Kiritimatiellia bacterium]HMP95987.1 HPr(Ser) kinase/phosphatase [Kiritimatiellia bacterium]
MTITLRQFFEAGRADLKLTIESGDGYLDHAIGEHSINRPGLALAGFFQYFARRRIQVIGLAEYNYLRSLSVEDRYRRLEQMFKKRIPALVFTRNRHATPEIKVLANRYKIPVLRTPMITGPFMNEATVLMEALAAPVTRVHGTTVDIMGVGVLIEGEPGIGKSEAALALIERGHSLVADDITVLRRESGNVITASSVEITRYHMEIRGLGIIHVPSLFGVAAIRTHVRLDLIIRLQRPSPQVELDRTGLNPVTRAVLGVEVPLVTLPVDAGRDLAHVVEVAALNQRLKMLGHDAAKELDDKLIEMLSKRRGRG